MSLRSLLHKLLGLDRYLRLISRIFIQTYLLRWYLPDHRLVKNLSALVKPGDTCIDIGANLGYFTIPLSHLVGEEGKVLAVEPVQAFRKVLEHNVERFALQNVEVFPFALGEKDGVTVKMVTPEVDGTMRHGRTSVNTGDSPGNTAYLHEVTMRTPQEIFGNLSVVHYLKCDVEGYEMHILPQLMPLFKKFKPIIEVEAEPEENKLALYELLKPLGYKMQILKEGVLQTFDPVKDYSEIELFFIPTN